MREYKPLFYIVSLLFLINTLNAQNQIEDSYQEYFQAPREVVYLHVSKDIFLPEEEIWFKGYLYDQKNAKPSKISKTINVGVYDSTGVLKKEQLYYLNDGFFKGSVKVDSTFADGRYFLKAKTNWMRNFNDGNSFFKELSKTNPSSMWSNSINTLLFCFHAFLKTGPYDTISMLY